MAAEAAIHDKSPSTIVAVTVVFLQCVGSAVDRMNQGSYRLSWMAASAAMTIIVICQVVTEDQRPPF